MLKSEERNRKTESGWLHLKEDNYRQGLFDEEERIQRVRFIVDSASDRLQYFDLAWDEARQVVEETKRLVLELFPDKEGLFDLIYRPRFYRIIESKPIV